MQPDQLINSAKGWHSIQLAVLGFLGLCGVMRVGETPAGPDWMAWWSAGMAILSFISALMSMWMVGGVAFPAYSGEQMPATAPGRLKRGIGMTFVAVIMTILSALDGWWPSDGGEKLEVRDSAGNSACGTVVDGAKSGWVFLETETGVVNISLSAVAVMRPVSSCS